MTFRCVMVCFQDVQSHLSTKGWSQSSKAITTLAWQRSQGLFSVPEASAGHDLH